jgi:hypothetical protein
MKWLSSLLQDYMQALVCEANHDKPQQADTPGILKEGHKNVTTGYRQGNRNLRSFLSNFHATLQRFTSPSKITGLTQLPLLSKCSPASTH